MEPYANIKNYRTLFLKPIFYRHQSLVALQGFADGGCAIEYAYNYFD